MLYNKNDIVFLKCTLLYPIDKKKMSSVVTKNVDNNVITERELISGN